MLFRYGKSLTGPTYRQAAEPVNHFSAHGNQGIGSGYFGLALTGQEVAKIPCLVSHGCQAREKSSLQRRDKEKRAISRPLFKVFRQTYVS